MKYELISFDLDGTLVDTASEIAEAANCALQDQGLARRSVEEITRLIGLGTRELILKLLARCQSEEPEVASKVRQEDLLSSMNEHYSRVTGTSGAPYIGCREMLAGIESAGVRIACVTNKELRHAIRVLQVTGLDRHFDLTIGGDSLSEKKPHASVLNHVARVLQADPERSAHLGDSAIDVAAARNSGLAAWAVSYGYNGGVPIATAAPDRIFDTLFEVSELVLSR